MKITRATLKSFIKKNKDNLFIKVNSSFDGMTDCVQEVEDNFTKVDNIDFNDNHSFGIRGLWLVGESRDYFKEWEDKEYKGIEIYNCCGTSIIAIKK